MIFIACLYLQVIDQEVAMQLRGRFLKLKSILGNLKGNQRSQPWMLLTQKNVPDRPLTEFFWIRP